MNFCEYCGRQTVNPKFCSQSCSATASNKSRPRRREASVCKNCNKEFYPVSSSYGKFCGNSCSSEARSKETERRYLAGEVVPSVAVLRRVVKSMQGGSVRYLWDSNLARYGSSTSS